MESTKSILENIKMKRSSKSSTPKREEFISLPATSKSRMYKYLTLSELMNLEYPEIEWVAESLIPEGLTVLSAQPASYKTWILLDLALSVASGKKLFQTFECNKNAVLIVDEENSGRLLQQRIKMLGYEEPLPIHFMIEKDFKLEDSAIAETIKFCKKNAISLISFDSLVRIHKSNENDASQMAEVFSKLRRFTKVGINVLVTHHNRKGGKNEVDPRQEMRGSSDILAAVDCHLSLKRNRDNNNLIITQTKVRSTQEIAPIELKVISSETNLNFEYIGAAKITISKRSEAIQSILKVLATSRLNQKEILHEVETSYKKINAKTLRLILNELVENESIVSSPGKGSEIIYTLA